MEARKWKLPGSTGIALWPWSLSESREIAESETWWRNADWLEDVPDADVKPFADDAVARSLEFARATSRVEDRAHNTLVLCFTLIGAVLASSKWHEESHVFELLFLTLAATVLIKTRFPLPRMAGGFNWPSTATWIRLNGTKQEFRARSAHLSNVENGFIQSVIAKHISVALGLIAAALVAFAVRLSW